MSAPGLGLSVVTVATTGNVVVQWNADGSYTPRCEPCGYEGKPVLRHHVAATAVRRHEATAKHRVRTLEAGS